jgi:NADH:ubiquinone oxidoreductase subunit 6 (subunit J)
MVAHLALAPIILIAAAAAVFSERLVRAAIALAIGNSALSLYFLLHQARYAGVVQLSVGVGLLSALFLVAISLTEPMRKGPDGR